MSFFIEATRPPLGIPLLGFSAFMLSDPGGRPDLSVEHSLTIWFELTDGTTFSDGKIYGAVYVDSVPPIYFMNTKSISSSSRTLIGKCLCGAVQVSMADEFLYAGYCHCPDCRASSGSAFSAFAGIPKEKLQLTCGAESISKFRKNEDNVIHFCRHCGSWLFSIVRDGEFAHVRLGILIDDPSIRPTFHIFVGSKAPWYTISDGLPQFVGLPDDVSV